MMITNEEQLFIQSNILRDMSEGMLVVDLKGIIREVNPAACGILCKSREELCGRPFASCFFDYAENDEFNQTILDAVYSSGEKQERIVPFRTAEGIRTLNLRASFLKEGEKRRALIVVISDISELESLRDAVKAMRQIQALNRKLEMKNEFLQKTFGRYISDDIVKTLLESPEGLVMGGKKRVVTVMMSDLRGFTALSHRMEPGALLEMLNHYFEEIYEVIEAYRGTLLEFLGDGLFVVFGAPVASEDHAARAAAAALAMQQRMRLINAWNRARGYEELAMGIALNTGECIVGNIGSEKRTKYGVVGMTVNTAGRTESYCSGGDILITQATREAISEPLKIAGSKRVHFKGMEEETEIYKLEGIGGSYAVALEEEKEDWVSLKEPWSGSIYRVKDKEVLEEAFEGRIVRISRHKALLETEMPLTGLDNLFLDLEGGLYGKVLRREAENGYLLHLTSLTPAYEERIRPLLAFSSGIV